LPQESFKKQKRELIFDEKISAHCLNILHQCRPSLLPDSIKKSIIYLVIADGIFVAFFSAILGKA
jgi:hypothetical protein